MVSVRHFTTSNHPDIGRWHSPRGAESIKLDYGMIQKKFQKICMKVFFLTRIHDIRILHIHCSLCIPTMYYFSTYNTFDENSNWDDTNFCSNEDLSKAHAQICEFLKTSTIYWIIEPKSVFIINEYSLKQIMCSCCGMCAVIINECLWWYVVVINE